MQDLVRRLLPDWTPVELFRSKHATHRSRGLALARIKLGREADDQGLGPRSPAPVRNAYQAPDGRYYEVTIREIRVESDDQLRRELAELRDLVGES